MAGSIGRSISIGLSANTKNFAKGLKDSEKRMAHFKNAAKITGTAVATSFAAMGAAALFFGKMAVSAALEDQKAQSILSKTVRNNTKYRKGLVKDTEKTINALESQYNIVDDKLRPAFGKLVIATKSVSKSQKLIRTAIDVSALSGKSLDSVVTALSRAYLGSNTAIGKLGLGIDKAKLKTMTFDQILSTITKKTGGAGKAAAGTYQGAVDGLSIAWQNFQESVGYKILPKLGQLLKYIKTDLIPFLGEVKTGFDGIAKDKNSPAAKLGIALKTMVTAFSNLFTGLSGNQTSDGLSTLEQMAGALTTVANAITSVTNAVSGAAKWWNKDGFWQNGKLTLPGGHVVDVTPWGSSGNSSPSVGGGNGSWSSYVTPSGGTNMQPASMGGNTVINLNGIVDAESASRAIQKLLQASSLRTGQVVVNRNLFA
jgi:uncharacterized protein with GYD domain